MKTHSLCDSRGRASRRTAHAELKNRPPVSFARHMALVILNGAETTEKNSPEAFDPRLACPRPTAGAYKPLVTPPSSTAGLEVRILPPGLHVVRNPGVKTTRLKRLARTGEPRAGRLREINETRLNGPPVPNGGSIQTSYGRGRRFESCQAPWPAAANVL